MTINLNINGKTCRLVVNPEEEKDFRDARKLVCELIESYRNRYNSMSAEDVLTRVALDVAVNYIIKERELSEIADEL